MKRRGVFPKAAPAC